MHVGNAAALVRQAERDTGDRAGLTARAREDDVLRAIGYLPPAEYEARYYQQGL